MNADKQAALEQVAREWLKKNCSERLCLPSDVQSLVALLAAQRKAVLEEAAQYVLGGSFLHDDAPAAQFAREVAAMLRRKAQEQRP